MAGELHLLALKVDTREGLCFTLTEIQEIKITEIAYNPTKRFTSTI